MRYQIGYLRRHIPTLTWIAGLAITAFLVLLMACGESSSDDLSSATPTDAPTNQAAGAPAASSPTSVPTEAPRQGEDRPAIAIIGGGAGSVSVSVSGTGPGTGSVSGTAAMAGQLETGGLSIPTGLSYETDRSVPTKSDGYYTPTSHREIYQKISTDYQEIAKLTNVIKEGKPLPAAEIWLLYEVGSHTRLGSSSRTLRNFASGPSASTYFPDSAAFYGSYTFLDDPIENAVRGRREAENYSDAQRRQAINKSALRIIYHWSKFYMIIGGDRMNSRLVDEAWAVYVGEEVNGEYPNSLAATAVGREGNFGRQGTIDIPLRQAMDRARQAADDGDAAAYEAAAGMSTLASTPSSTSTVRYIGRVADDAQAGNHDDLKTHQVEALSFYRSIQPDVAKANPAVNDTIVAYLERNRARLRLARATKSWLP